MPNKFSIHVGKDKHYPAYSGKIANIRLNGGDGAFAPTSYSGADNDIFGYK